MTKNKVKTIKVSFADSREREVNYLCFLASEIAGGVFQKHDFAVLPYPVNLPKAVYFPNLAYDALFWREIKKSPHRSVARLFPENARKEIDELLPATSSLSSPEKSWRKIERPFFEALAEAGLFQKELQKVASITVLATPFGTIGSFHHIFKKAGKIEIFCTCQPKRKTSQLAKTIILSLLVIKNPDFAEKKWQDKQAIADFLLSSTKLNKVFPDFEPETEASLPAKLRADSQKFLEKLGFGKTKRIRLVDDRLFYGGKSLEKKFSSQEKAILRLLVRLQGEIADYSEMARAMWGENFEEKFSLWAINKAVQKIRKKLSLVCRQTNFINTVYGKGYYLSS